MYKMHALIAGVATLGFMMLASGCATLGFEKEDPNVYLPDSYLSFRVGKDPGLVHTHIALGNCKYHLDTNENGSTANCPTLLRVHNTRVGGVINLLAFPVAGGTFLTDIVLQKRLGEEFEKNLKGKGRMSMDGLIQNENRLEIDVTFEMDANKVMKERVLILRITGKKESIVVMVGVWPKSANKEMLAIRDQIAADILASNLIKVVSK